MSDLTIEELRNLIKETILEVHKEEGTLPALPAGVVSAVVLTKAERIKRFLQVLSTFGVAVVAVSLFINSFLLTPHIKSVAQEVSDASMKVHVEDVIEKMDGVRDKYLLKEEFNVWAASKDERWRQLDLDIAEIKATLIKVQDNQVEILRRVR